MSKASTVPDFKRSVAAALADEKLGKAVERATLRQDVGRKEIMPELPDPLATRELAKQIKNHTLQNLDRYLEQLANNVRQLGGQVHFASTAEQAREIVVDIARSAEAKLIVKGKSMVTEEIELNPAIEAAGFEVVETDLGEYIIQLDNDRPSHIVAPVIHKSKEEIGRLFADKLGIAYTSDPQTLAAAARKVLREKFKAADMGIIGANFAVAETGSVCIVTNEGNGRFCSSRPRVLVSVMGMEKIIPRMQDLPVFLKLLSRSATGQRISCYTSLITGPKRPGDFDGPEEFHLVILDCGRTDILSSEYRDILWCLRCGACLNACPVYRTIGGHAYESVYPGPIGKVITPLLKSLEAYEDLPQASSLCGACLEACPVLINIPYMLVRLRNELLKRGRMPFVYRWGFKFWKTAMRSRFLYHWGAKLGHWFNDAGARDGWLKELPGMAGGWTDHRDFPAMADRPFHERWAEFKEQLDSEDQP